VNSREASSHNNVVGASARLRRAPEYTARKLWWSVEGEAVVGRSMVDEQLVPGAASPTSERYGTCRRSRDCGNPKAADCRKEASLLFGADASAVAPSAGAAVIPGRVWDLFGGSPALAATGRQVLDGDSRGKMG
jgi:hypothetical protein